MRCSILFRLSRNLRMILGASSALVATMLLVGCLSSSGKMITLAGNGTFGYSGDGGYAINAELASPTKIALDPSGNLYIADTGNHVIREVLADTGIINTVAGTGTAGYSGDNGPATSATLNQPYGVAIDSSGNIYIADSGNNVIRKVTAHSGFITTVAGNGAASYTGDSGPATSATLNRPYGVAVDSSANLYIADTHNNVIREVAAASSVITTVAGSGTAGYTGDNGPATSAMLSSPYGLAVDSSGNFYIADSGNNVIRKITAATGIITTVAGSGTAGYTGNYGAATSATLNGPYGVAVDSSGNLYVADAGNNVIREVAAASGVITTIAGTGTPGYSGDDGPAINATLDDPYGVAIDPSGNLYIADAANNVVREVTH